MRTLDDAARISQLFRHGIKLGARPPLYRLEPSGAIDSRRQTRDNALDCEPRQRTLAERDARNREIRADGLESIIDCTGRRDRRSPLRLRGQSDRREQSNDPQPMLTQVSTPLR
jgi:hypothetical protein